MDDTYRELGVREYARELGVSAPTASKILAAYLEEGILKRREERRYLLYSPDREHEVFMDIARLYWKQKLIDSGLIAHIDEVCIAPAIILFGSLTKGQARQHSDFDLAVVTLSKKTIDVEKWERRLKRPIQILMFKDMNHIPEHLFSSIISGQRISGWW